MKQIAALLAFFTFLVPHVLNAQDFDGSLEYSLIQDTDGDGFADPGDIVRYKAVVTNSNTGDGVSVEHHLNSGFTLVPNSITTTSGTAEVVSQFSGTTIKVKLDFTVPANSTNTIIFSVTPTAPLGFEPGNTSCAQSFIIYPDSSTEELFYVNGSQLGFGSCPPIDFDNDEIEDREDICHNSLHSSPRLDLELPINNSGAPISTTSTINISRTGSVEGLGLKLLLKHTWVGDLKIILTHVTSGKSVVIIDRPGHPAGTDGCSSDNIRAEFSESNFPTAEDSCISGPYALSGLYSAMESFNEFLSDSISGEWKLTIIDNFPAGDGGSLTQWCIDFDSSTNISANISAPVSAFAGSNFNQKITLTNNGPADMYDLVISHLPSSGLTPLELSPFSLIQLPVGQTKTLDHEVKASNAFPYKELIITSPSSVAGEYFLLNAPYGSDLTPGGGITGELVNIKFQQFSCAIQNSSALAGKIALSGQNFCSSEILAQAAAAAGALAIILPTNNLGSPDILRPLQVAFDPATININIPVLSAKLSSIIKLTEETGPKQGTLRANPLRTNWEVTTTFSVSSDVMRISNSNVLAQQTNTKTEILIDSDEDGTADKTDLCPGDNSKSSLGVCGCGIADTDSDADGRADCLDQCAKDPGKTTPGTCGCGMPDSDTNSNSIIDCLTGSEILSKYNAINTSYKKIKPVKISGNKKKDKAKKAALKSKVAEIKALITSIELLVKNPILPVALNDASLNLSTETSNLSKVLLTGLKTNSKNFKKNKKAVTAGLTKILSLIKK